MDGGRAPRCGLAFRTDLETATIPMKSGRLRCLPSMFRQFCLDYGFDRGIFRAGVREGHRGNDACCGLKLVAVLAGKEHEKGAER